jgi:hypothetical protein
MIGSLLRQTLNLLEVSFQTHSIRELTIQAIFSLMRKWSWYVLTHTDSTARQLESSSEKEGVMNELPNSMILPICPREKLLMLSRLGTFSSSLPASSS